MALCQENWDRNFKEKQECLSNAYVFLPLAVRKKVKVTLEQVLRTQTGSKGTAVLFFLISGPDGVGGQRHIPAAVPPRKTWYPFYKKLGGP